jgi:hypothetical protein
MEASRLRAVPMTQRGVQAQPASAPRFRVRIISASVTGPPALSRREAAFLFKMGRGLIPSGYCPATLAWLL